MFAWTVSNGCSLWGVPGVFEGSSLGMFAWALPMGVPIGVFTWFSVGCSLRLRRLVHRGHSPLSPLKDVRGVFTRHVHAVHSLGMFPDACSQDIRRACSQIVHKGVHGLVNGGK